MYNGLTCYSDDNTTIVIHNLSKLRPVCAVLSL